MFGSFYITGGQCIQMGDDFHAGKECCLQSWQNYNGKKTQYNPVLILGNNVSLMSNCQISCMNRIVIGDGCLLGDNVFITDNYHGSNSLSELEVPPISRDLFSKGTVSIGNNVWLGRNVCVMPGVTIGDGVIIGANAVVTHDIPSNSIAAGIPAKVIRNIE